MHQLSTRLALILFMAILTGFRGQATAIISVKSGNWGSSSTWNGGVVPLGEDHVTIRSGDTVIIESSGKYCASLTVEEGAILYANKSTVTSSPRYIYVYGDIL